MLWKLYAPPPPPSPTLNTSPPSYNYRTIQNMPYGCIVFALSIKWACKLALEPGLTGRASLREEAGRGVPTCRDLGKIGKTATLGNIFHQKKSARRRCYGGSRNQRTREGTGSGTLRHPVLTSAVIRKTTDNDKAAST